MEDQNIEEVIEKAKSQRLQTLFDRRVALLKAEDGLKQLGGEDDYELSLSAIVTAYPNGITLSRVRELLPISKTLDEAKDALKAKGLIDVGTDKRSPLLKPKAVNMKPSDGDTGEPATPAPAPKKPTPQQQLNRHRSPHILRRATPKVKSQGCRSQGQPPAGGIDHPHLKFSKDDQSNNQLAHADCQTVDPRQPAYYDSRRDRCFV